MTPNRPARVNPLTKQQKRVMARLEKSRDAKVVDWDRSVQGPILRFAAGVAYVAITPKGKEVDKTEAMRQKKANVPRGSLVVGQLPTEQPR